MFAVNSAGRRYFKEQIVDIECWEVQTYKNQRRYSSAYQENGKFIYTLHKESLLKAFNTILENKNQFSLQKKMFCEVLMFELWKFPSIRVLANFI